MIDSWCRRRTHHQSVPHDGLRSQVKHRHHLHISGGRLYCFNLEQLQKSECQYWTLVGQFRLSHHNIAYYELRSATWRIEYMILESAEKLYFVIVGSYSIHLPADISSV